MLSSSLGRLIGGIFSGSPLSTNSAEPQVPSGPSRSSNPAANITVGQGGPKERHVTIAGVPMLFRDEGDVVVQFQPEFDYDLHETAVGAKLIPSLTPHWAVCAEHQCGLTQAIAIAIKAGFTANQKPATPAATFERTVREIPARAEPRVESSSARADSAPLAENVMRRNDRPNFGRIKEWGEKKFPDGKRPGKFYDSFCLTLTARGQDRVLQGEGLRDAIADVGCQIGELVEVKRLGKIKVPAVDKQGVPKLDDHGQQLLWDKWQWSIKRKS
jgi:hypothetical protein